MSSAGRARRHQSSGAYATELDWLRDHGVRIDEKGRIIVSFPIPDDEFEFRNEEEPSIAELMRRNVDPRHGGSRGRRRRCAPKASQRSEPACTDRPMRPARLGRPSGRRGAARLRPDDHRPTNARNADEAGPHIGRSP